MVPGRPEPVRVGGVDEAAEQGLDVSGRGAVRAEVEVFRGFLELQLGVAVELDVEASIPFRPSSVIHAATGASARRRSS